MVAFTRRPNPDSDHLSHVDSDPDSNLDLGPGVNAALACAHIIVESLIVKDNAFKDRMAAPFVPHFLLHAGLLVSHTFF